MTTRTVDGIVHEIAGTGDLVVLIHGLGGTSNTWSAMLGAFDGYRCVRPDLPGSGRSRLDGPVSVAGFVASVRRLIAAVGDATDVHLVGHSMGCIVALQLAAADPRRVRSLTLFGPLLAPPDPARDAIAERGRRARREGVAGMQLIADQLLETAVSGRTRRERRTAFAFVRESLMRQPPDGYAASCEALATVEPIDPSPIACPVLLVTGDEDRVAPPPSVHALAARLPDARVVVLPGCGHWHPVELPDECGRLAADLLARADRRAQQEVRRNALATSLGRSTTGAAPADALSLGQQPALGTAGPPPAGPLRVRRSVAGSSST